MSRMLAALKELEAKSPQPQQLPAAASAGQPGPPRKHDAPPPMEAAVSSAAPPEDERVIEAALAQVEIAAAAVRQQQAEADGDSPAAPWPIPHTRQHAGAFRQLAENVLCQVSPGGLAVLMFTSPRDGDGKTELLVSLAAALTQRNPQRLLLLDANWHKPDLAGFLGIQPVRGLAHVLAGAAKWQQVVQESCVPRLDLLPGVTSPAPEVGPPGQGSLRPLLAELRSRYGLVLVDAPALSHAEVAPLAACCDGTYLVVRLNRTTRRDLARSLALIRGCGGHLLGSVVIGA